MKTVFDTNILMDFWVFRNPECQPLLEACRAGVLEPLRCAATLYELRDVIGRSQFSLAPGAQAAILAEWMALSADAASTPQGLFCQDPDDGKFLDLALSAGASWLVTRDRHLLKIRGKARRRGLSILTPREALGRLAALRPARP